MKNWNKRISFFIFFSLIISLQACKEAETESLEIDFGYEYYPLAVGQERIYKVDSLVFKLEGSIIDTTSGFARESITEVFQDASGISTYSIERSYRKSNLDEWNLEGVYSAQISNDQAIRKEANLPYLKLIFPIKENNSWDPTAFFNSDQDVLIGGSPIEFFKLWEANLVETGIDVVVQNTDYDEVLRLTQADAENLIERRFWEEFYAPGVGLIKRRVEIVDTQCRRCCDNDTNQCLNISWEEKAEQGLILTEELISFK